jgi:DNA-binding NarL/FixJ family response regulator
MSGRVLIVEDEFLIADTLADMVASLQLEVCATADTASRAVALAQFHRPELVLMDVRLKGEADGVDAARAIHEVLDCPVIFITGSQEPATVARIKTDHPAAILFKPITFDQLRRAVVGVAGGMPGRRSG